jgi:hypothetical protein
MDSPECRAYHSIPGASAGKASTASGNPGESLCGLLIGRDIGCNVRDCGSVDLSTAKSPSAFLLSGVQPGRVVLAGEDDRHAIVDPAHQRVGVRHGDAAGLKRRFVCVRLSLQESRHCERVIVFALDQERRFATLPGLPLVESFRRNQAVLVLAGVAVGGLGAERPGAGIDHAVGLVRPLRPRGNEAPAQRDRRAPASATVKASTARVGAILNRGLASQSSCNANALA